MNDKERHDFFKDLYDKEFTRKENIENSVNIPITITTAVAILIFFLLSEYEYKDENIYLNVLFYLPVIIASVLTLIGLYYLIKAYVSINHDPYRAIPYANQLDNYRISLNNYYTTNLQTLSHTTAEALFLNYLTDLYIQQTSSNTRINDTKLKELNITKLLLSISLSLLVFGFFPFFYNYFTKPDKTHFIEIKNKIPINLGINNSISNDSLRKIQFNKKSTQPKEQDTLIAPIKNDSIKIYELKGPKNKKQNYDNSKLPKTTTTSSASTRKTN
ncbi:hypothetical protein [Rufibacter soli]